MEQSIEQGYRKRFSLHQNFSNQTKVITSTSQFYANQSTSPYFVVATSSVAVTSASLPSHPCLTGCHNSPSSPLCNNRVEEQSSCFFASSDHDENQKRHHRNLQRSISSSDDDMNAGSPDSGFESATPINECMIEADDLDEFLQEHNNEEVSESSHSTTSSYTPEPPLCLTPPQPVDIPEPVKERSLLACKWQDCHSLLSSSRELHLHITSEHVSKAKSRFCCLWENCKVYDKPARTLHWLQQHVAIHTGDKRFKCVLEGCDASFSSASGLARHVPSHFNEVNLPKARLANAERRLLVKRRRIKDKRKALANLHDCMDKRSINFMISSLVRLVQPSSFSLTKCCDSEVISKRICADGSKWHLSNRHSWTRDKAASQLHDGLLFFSTPTPRCRKRKVLR